MKTLNPKPYILYPIFVLLLFLPFRPLFAYDRVIVLAPSIGEIFAYLDLTQYVVGRVAHCDYPPEIKNKKIVGDFSNPNEELILSLNPQAMFGVDLEQAPFKKRFKKYDIKVYSFSYKNIQDIVDSMYKILDIMDKRTPARVKKIDDFKKRLYKVRAKKAKKTAVFLIWDKPLMAAGPNSFISDIMRYAGLHNAAKLKREYSQISPELLVQFNPEYLVLGYMSNDRKMYKDFVSRFKPLKLKSMQKENIIYDINPDIILRPGPRIIEGIAKLKSEIR